MLACINDRVFRKSPRLRHPRFDSVLAAGLLTVGLLTLVGCDSSQPATRGTPETPSAIGANGQGRAAANAAARDDAGSPAQSFAPPDSLQPSVDDVSSGPTPVDVEDQSANGPDGTQREASTLDDGPAGEAAAGEITLTDAAQPDGTGDAAPAGDGQVQQIVFEDIQLPIQADMVFRPFMLTERVKSLDGRRVRISGYMLPDSKTRGITQFVLLKNTECKFGPGGQADHLINVLMADGETANFRDDPVSVEGVLSVNPFQGPDGNTWSIYDLACDHVEIYRPRR